MRVSFGTPVGAVGLLNECHGARHRWWRSHLHRTERGLTHERSRANAEATETTRVWMLPIVPA